MKRALAGMLLFVCLPARAWDSRCADDGAKGPAAAKCRWIDSQSRDEHRQIWLETLRRAGLNAASGDLDADFTLSSFTAGFGTFQPAPLLTAQVERLRVHSPSEFAQLPDFSYSLWDWSLGNETCPLGGASDALLLSSCHSFLMHMGPVNSNHFPPQTSTHYNRYHRLAMERAADCKLVRDRVGARADLRPFVDACVSEALVLEAIAHHYLQDSWSMGHLWQRWGSPNIGDFPDTLSAMAVAGFSGLIHGAKALLTVDDGMCAPSDPVNFLGPAGATPAVGDMFLPLLSQAKYADQFAGMYGCTVGSLRAVLQVAGVPLDGVAPGITPVDPSTHDDACFGKRATNRALLAGFAIDTSVGSFPLEELAPGVALVGPELNNLALELVPLQYDILKVGALITFHAIKDPLGTNLAEGGFGDFGGMPPNGAFKNVLGSYLDPDLPWPGPSGLEPHELALARQFHQAHARDWCGKFQDGDPELDLHKLSARVGATSGATQSLACDICTEFAERHLRIGDPATYVATADNEPLCGLIAAAPSAAQYVYQPDPSGGLASRHALARRFCTCGVTVTVTPKAASLASGGSQQFTATVSGSTNTGIAWTSTRGSIDNTGLFTAGTTAGTVKVRAASLADPSAFDEATVAISVLSGNLTKTNDDGFNGDSDHWEYSVSVRVEVGADGKVNVVEATGTQTRALIQNGSCQDSMGVLHPGTMGQTSSGTISGGRFQGFVFFPLQTSITITDFGLDPANECAAFSTTSTNVGLHSDGPAFSGTPVFQDGILTAIDFNSTVTGRCAPRSHPNGVCVTTGRLVPGQ